MAGNPHPVFQDGVPVEKANARAYLPLRLGNPDALRALDGSTFWLCYIQTLTAFFYRDTSDTTSADDGTSIIVDASGGRWKIISSGAGLAIDAAGPLASRTAYNDEDPGFTYFGTDTELVYIRLTAGGWSAGSIIQGPPGIDGPPGEKGDKGDTGDIGPANTLSIGTVTGGDSANATITGTAPNQTLNLTLPKGETGDTGSQGPKGDTGDTGPQGEQGPQGEKGDKGDKGDTGASGSGTGDMLAAVYDPNGKAADAFNQDNMVDGATNKNYTATEKTKLAGLTKDTSEPVTQVTGSSATVSSTDVAIAVVRSSPSSTALALPAVSTRGGVPLKIFDWSSSVSSHEITITPDGSEKIMKASSWSIFSNAAQLAGITLYPSTTLGGWYIAP